MISKLKEGNADYLKKIYTLYFDRVYNLCFTYTKDKDLAQDFVQEVFLKIWKNKQNISDDIPIEQQLFVISKNLIFDHYRRKIKEEEVFLNYKELLNEDSSNEDEYKKIKLDKIHTWIDQLPKKQQKVLKMHRFQGLTYEEIADLLNISVHTVSAHISSGMRTIKKNLI